MFTVNGWSDEVKDTKFEILGTNNPYIRVGVKIPRFFFFTILRTRGNFMVMSNSKSTILLLPSATEISSVSGTRYLDFSFSPFCVREVISEITDS